jgi:hypothetical protein
MRFGVAGLRFVKTDLCCACRRETYTMTDPGFVYLIVKSVLINGARHLCCANNMPMCKVGKGIHPPDRLAEAVGEASTWHPEEFQLLCMKFVPSMKFAEDKIHEFFKETNVTPAYPKGGIEWFLADPARVRWVMEALEGDPIRESADGLVRPPPVKRSDALPQPVVIVPAMTYAAWKEVIQQNELRTAGQYSDWQEAHPDFPSLDDLTTGCFEGHTNYNVLVTGVFGAERRQR